MNRERRQLIKTICADIQSIYKRLEEVYDAEQEAMDNYPEGLQDTQIYADMESACENIEEAMDGLLETQTTLEGIL